MSTVYYQIDSSVTIEQLKFLSLSEHGVELEWNESWCIHDGTNYLHLIGCDDDVCDFKRFGANNPTYIFEALTRLLGLDVITEYELQAGLPDAI